MGLAALTHAGPWTRDQACASCCCWRVSHGSVGQQWLTTGPGALAEAVLRDAPWHEPSRRLPVILSCLTAFLCLCFFFFSSLGLDLSSFFLKLFSFSIISPSLILQLHLSCVFFFLNIYLYLFIWLYEALALAYGIFSYGVWDLCLTRDRRLAP